MAVHIDSAGMCCLGPLTDRPQLKADPAPGQEPGRYHYEDQRPVDRQVLPEDCAADRVYEFFFCAPPLPITGAVGSPINPQAIK